MTGAVDQVLRQRFLDGMSHIASTVNVVTTDGPAGKFGVTVSAMSSVSADTERPTLLVCVHHLSRAAEAIVENKVFCVNVLRDDQSHISDAFAGRYKTETGDKFDCTSWTIEKTGSPRVTDPLVAFDCRMMSAQRVGTHYVFIGEVEHIYQADRGLPLIFANRAYGSPTQIEAGAPGAAVREEGSGQLAIGCFHTFGPFVIPGILAELEQCAPDIAIRLVEGDQRRIIAGLRSGELDVGLIYDLDIASDMNHEVLAQLPVHVLMAAGHPLAALPEITIDQLADHPFILLDGPPSRDYFLSIFENAGIAPKLKMTSASFEMVRGMVGHGLGYTLLATKPVSDQTYDGKPLAIRKLKSDTPANRVIAAFAPNRQKSAAACLMVDKAKAYLSDWPASDPSGQHKSPN